MIPSEQGNRPRWSGRGFEIWFFVVLVPGASRALWVRLTRFANHEGSDARVWAVLSEAGRVTAERDILPVDALTTEGDAGQLHVRVGEAAELGHGFSRGRCGAIAWDFEYDASDPLVERLPKLPSFLPLGTHSTHPHAEAKVRGWMSLDGQRLPLDGGMLTQMHIWGTQRVEFLRWAWAPRFEGHGEDTELELTAVAPRADGPNLCALWARIGSEEVLFDHSGLTKSARASVESLRPGVLHHVAQSGGRRLVVRVWAPAETFAGWDYRMVDGGDLHVAQSNLAKIELEVYRRAGLGWRPEKRLISTCGAVEFHGPEDYPEFRYVPWESRSTEVRTPKARLHGHAPASAPGPGEWITTPEPTRIVALGLTYKAHAKETGNSPDSVIFEIDANAWSTGDGEILRPSTEQLSSALRDLDPQLPPMLADFGFIPAMLDYEVELGLLLLDGLDNPHDPGRVGLVVANDVSARVLQILGEGERKRLDYWRVAKSFYGFTPTTARAWVPESFDLHAWPKLTLETRVNGKLRQSACVDLLIESPARMLVRVRESAGSLPPGTLLLTGTPAGVALSVPRWKRTMGERLLDRAGRLRAAIGGFSAGTEFLRPGDRVAVSGGFLGGFERVVTIRGQLET